jgi:uncharacterized repeat protein (TIGR03806 family)
MPRHSILPMVLAAICGGCLLAVNSGAQAQVVERWDASDLADGPVTSWISQGPLSTAAHLPSSNGGNPTKTADGVVFDGNDALEVPAGSNFLIGKNEWTASVVFRANGAAGEGGATRSTNPAPGDPSQWWSNAALVGVELAGGNSGDWGLFLNSDSEAVFGNGGAPSTGFVNAGVALDDNCIHVLTSVFDSLAGTRSLYLNGVLIQEQQGVSISTPTDTINFGCNILASPNDRAYFRGKISTIILTDEALTATEVRAQHIALGTSPLALPPDLPSGTYATEDAFPGLIFADPVAIVTPPGESNRLFVVEQIGRISVIPDLANPTRQTFLDIQGIVRSSGNEEGLLGLAFHPNYHTSGQPGYRQFFVFFQTTNGGQRHWRLSRFTVSAGDPNVADAGSEVPLITQRDQAGNHNGGDIHFGDDGYLYIAVGDEGGANDTYDNSRHIDKDFFGAIFRIDVDQQSGNLVPNTHSSVHAGTYRVPADNPFVGATSHNGLPVTPGSVRTEIWAIGLRNPWRMSFDRPTDRLFVADVGQVSYEEINIMSAAVFAANGGIRNYGWSYREGFHAFTSGPGGSTPPPGFAHIDPIHEYPRSQGRSITGGLVYRGSQYPELAGDYLFSDYVTGRIWAMEDPGGPNQAVEQIASDTQIAGFGIDPSTDEILLADDNSNRQNDDQIKRLVYSTPAGTAVPNLLSEVGAFSDLATLTPEQGVTPYDINVPFWSDSATKTRWFTLPENSDEMIWAQDNNWHFPKGQAWIKHFDLDLNRDNPGTSVRRLETRFLVRTATDFYGITYRWNDAQTDAQLVDEDGLTEEFTITEGGQPRTQTWTYPSRNDCRTCHTPVGGIALGFNTRQLNKDFDFGSGDENQIAHFETAGYFSNDPPDPSGLPTLYAADDQSASIEDRARSYLAANCVQCHQNGGPALGNWTARPELTTAATGIVDGLLVNNGGDSFNRLLAPGDTPRSMLISRLAAVGNHGSPLAGMPPLATSVVNQQAIDLLTQWAALENETPNSTATGDSLVLLPTRATLSGTASDDGFPRDPGNISITWTRLSGPGSVGFSNANATDTSAVFSAPGDYVLRLTVDDGSKTSTSDVNVAVAIGLDHWKSQLFSTAQLADDAVSGNFADFEFDGLTTIEEFLFDTDPLNHDPTPVTIFLDNDRLTAEFSIRKYTGGISTRVFVGDLPGNGGTGTAHIEEEIVSDDGVWLEMRVRDKTTTSDTNQRFMWLQFEAP